MRDRVSDDVGNVRINEFVHHLPASASGGDQSSASEHPQVLADERLRHPQRVHQLVYAVCVVREEVDHRQPYGSGERAKELAALFVRSE